MGIYSANTRRQIQSIWGLDLLELQPWIPAVLLIVYSGGEMVLKSQRNSLQVLGMEQPNMDRHTYIQKLIEIALMY